MCSMFAELCAFARTEFPQPSVEQFLSLHQSLKHAVAVADALASARNTFDTTTPADNTTNGSNEKGHGVAEKARCAASWVNAALSSDLATFSVQSKQGNSGTARNLLNKANNQQLIITVDGGPSLVPRGRSASPSMVARPSTTPSSPRFRTSLSSMPQSGSERRKDGAELRPQSPLKVLCIRCCFSCSCLHSLEHVLAITENFYWVNGKYDRGLL